MEIFNYGQFIKENQLDLFSGSGTEWDSKPGIASKIVEPQIQAQPEDLELLGTQSGTQSEVQDIDNEEDWKVAEIKYTFLLEKEKSENV